MRGPSARTAPYTSEGTPNYCPALRSTLKLNLAAMPCKESQVQRLSLCKDAIIAPAKKLLSERLHDKHWYKKLKEEHLIKITLEL